MRSASAATKTAPGSTCSRSPVGRCTSSAARTVPRSTTSRRQTVSSRSSNVAHLRLGERAEDDIRSRPPRGSVGRPRARERHRRDPSPGGQRRVVGRAEAAEDRVARRRERKTRRRARRGIARPRRAHRPARPRRGTGRARRRPAGGRRTSSAPPCRRRSSTALPRGTHRSRDRRTSSLRGACRAPADPGATTGAEVADACSRPCDRRCASARAAGSAMFLTCMPGRSVSRGPASTIRMRVSGRCSCTARANAEPTGPLPTTSTSTERLTPAFTGHTLSESESRF